MKPPVIRVSVLAAVGIVIVSLTFSPIVAPAGDRFSNADQIMFWLLGARMAQEQRPAKIDVNRATGDELRAIPGIEPQQVVRIIAERPYAKLRDLVRAGLSPRVIDRLAAFLTVNDDAARRVLGPSAAPNPR
jgi:predicted DNA-binding helix-hairpin-helix protein